MASAHDINANLGSAVASGHVLVADPGPDGTMEIGGKSAVVCVVTSSGVRILPDRPVGWEVRVIATAGCTITNDDGDTIVSPAAGTAVNFVSKGNGQWAAIGGTAGRLVGESVVPEFELSQAGDNNFQIGTPELEDYLDGREDIRSEPYILRNAESIINQYGWAEPIILGPDMCDDESGSLTTGYLDLFSPRAGYQGPYEGLLVRANGALSLSEAGPATGTLNIDPALNKALPKGFLLGCSVVGTEPPSYTEFLELTEAASVGDTALSVRLTNLGSGTQTVTISDNELLYDAARYTSQGAVNMNYIEGLHIVGRPTQNMDENSAINVGRGWACDGIVVPGTGAHFKDTKIGMIPGVCYHVRKKGNTFTRKGRHTPFEAEATTLENTHAYMAHIGRVWDAVDSEGRGANEAQDMTYFGDWFRAGSVTNVDAIHNHGVKGATVGGQGYDATAARVEGILRANYLELETSTVGARFLSGSSYSRVVSGRAYNNDNRCWEVYSGDCWFGTLRLTHGDAYTATNTGSVNQPALMLGDFAVRNVFEEVHVTVANSSRGIQLGENGLNYIEDCHIYRGVVLGTGDIGLYVNTSLTRGSYDIYFNHGFVNAVYFANKTIVEVDFTFRGPAACPITWPDGTTGTFGTPNVPSALIAAKNRITIVVDGSVPVTYGDVVRSSHAINTQTITYSASMTPNSDIYGKFVITATNGTAFTINNPTGTNSSHKRISIRIRNTSGGALGAITWGAQYKLGTWTSPATANSRTIDFDWDGTNWVEAHRTSADVPN